MEKRKNYSIIVILGWEYDNMNHYYTSVELGTNSIKILVCNKTNHKFHVIASIDFPSEGIKKGIVVDTKKAVSSTRKAFRKLDEMLGFKITKAIACVPTNQCRMDIVVGSTKVLDYHEIKGEDISNVLKDALVGQIGEDEELITAMPISFKVDDEEYIKDPKGYVGELLEAKVLISVSPKSIIYKVLEVLKLSGVEVVDIAYTSTGDYYEVRNKNLDKTVGAIVNIGEEITNISVFNKGIMIKNKILNFGSRNVDHDISYIYSLKRGDSRKLKESFVVALSSYADSNETVEVKTKEEKILQINQLDLSKIVEARLIDILKKVKNELKNLTKREIRYIIITGGISELAGFQYLTEDQLGIKARVCNITTMGVRNNKYSSVLGLVKYEDSKLALRGKSITMLNDSDIDNLISVKETKGSSDNIINKVFGRFFEN